MLLFEVTVFDFHVNMSSDSFCNGSIEAQDEALADLALRVGSELIPTISKSGCGANGDNGNGACLDFDSIDDKDEKKDTRRVCFFRKGDQEGGYLTLLGAFGLGMDRSGLTCRSRKDGKIHRMNTESLIASSRYIYLNQSLVIWGWSLGILGMIWSERRLRTYWQYRADQSPLFESFSSRLTNDHHEQPIPILPMLLMSRRKGVVVDDDDDDDDDNVPFSIFRFRVVLVVMVILISVVNAYIVWIDILSLYSLVEMSFAKLQAMYWGLLIFIIVFPSVPFFILIIGSWRIRTRLAADQLFVSVRQSYIHSQDRYNNGPRWKRIFYHHILPWNTLIFFLFYNLVCWGFFANRPIAGMAGKVMGKMIQGLSIYFAWVCFSALLKLWVNIFTITLNIIFVVMLNIDIFALLVGLCAAVFLQLFSVWSYAVSPATKVRKIYEEIVEKEGEDGGDSIGWPEPEGNKRNSRLLSWTDDKMVVSRGSGLRDELLLSGSSLFRLLPEAGMIPNYTEGEGEGDVNHGGGGQIHTLKGNSRDGKKIERKVRRVYALTWGQFDDILRDLGLHPRRRLRVAIVWVTLVFTMFIIIFQTAMSLSSFSFTAAVAPLVLFLTGFLPKLLGVFDESGSGGFLIYRIKCQLGMYAA